MQKRSKIVSVISYAGISTLIMAGFQVMLSSAPLTAMAQSATATPTPAKAAAAPAATATSAPTAAAPDPLKGKTIIASGLRQPRQLFYDKDGVLFIAEAGIGGDATLSTVATRTVQAGLTSRISMVDASGKQSIALEGLPSTATGGAPNFAGASSLYVTADSYWIGIEYGPDLKGVTFPLFHHLAQIDRKTHRIKKLVDTWTPAIEAKQPSPDDAFSNPTDLALAKDGTLYIADASANVLWSWTEKTGMKLVAKWDIKDNPVSASVAIGPDGDIYVGMLTGFPFKTGSARIERWSGGKLKQKYEGLTMVTDVLVTKEGDIYAAQYAEFGDKGPKPLSGKVVKIGKNGPETVMDGLPLPYGLAQNPKDGSIVVSVISAGDKDGKGAVIKVK